MTDQLTFGSLTIAFDDRVLRPREWTAAQSDWAAELMDTAPGGTVLELCAGAGHIGLLAVATSGRRLLCVDANPVACDYARANALAAGAAERVEVREGRLQDALAPGELFPVIIADPPWVPREQTSRYPEDPLTAIDGGDDGLDIARACLVVIDEHLAPGGSAVLQLGTSAQADILRAEPCFAEGRLVMVEVRQQVRGVLVRIVRA
ncbi:methyltransferase [Nocardioides pinisoli]|uniref:Methyltransferase n=1 Tax=Nocardioides pinisoli TaxID=2950279 RepID=A0ABT1KZ23_9ACTN|nr:methyltransferase [Nocardioides pinisoli]MCP3421866.1 methyltransferase [Nocardioides pinisoli]